MIALALVLTVPFGHPDSAAVWSYSVHAVVCEIAWQRLTPAAKAFVQEIRSHDPEPAPSFAESCSWADEVRRTTHLSTYEMHFINVDRGSERIDWVRDCGAYDCVTTAVIRYARYLTDGGQARRAQRRRAEALKFLGHFVGDLHQPLHAGYDDDLGGNRTRVLWDGAAIDLHRVWDVSIAERGGFAELAATEGLVAEITAREATAWETVDVFQWTEESYRLAADAAYALPEGEDLTGDYFTRVSTAARDQVKKAGVRLAHLLNLAAAGSLSFPTFP